MINYSNWLYESLVLYLATNTKYPADAVEKQLKAGHI
jgi:hypothetical protein